MRSTWRMVAGCVALGTMLSGCVVVVGNDLKGSEEGWRDDGRGPRIGIMLGAVDEALASQLNIRADDSTLIVGIIGDMPAQRAGVQVHDVVTAIDGSDHASPDDLRRAIRANAAGEELRLHILRGGQPMDLTVVMDKAAGAPEH